MHFQIAIADSLKGEMSVVSACIGKGKGGGRCFIGGTKSNIFSFLFNNIAIRG